jgi:cell division GTPase FtsZ
MTIQLQKPDITELKPRITVFGVGGGGGNAVNNMITAGLQGVDFVVANTDASTSPKVWARVRSRKSAALLPKSASMKSSTI